MKKIALVIALLASLWILFGSWFWTCKVQHDCSALYASNIEMPTEPTINIPQHLFNDGTYVYFDFAKHKVTSQGMNTINTFVNQIDGADFVDINVIGHTDKIGNDRFNEKLSAKRAEKVKNYLMLKGIKEETISVNYFGEDMPKASNSTEDGRQQNRRVQIKLSKK